MTSLPTNSADNGELTKQQKLVIDYLMANYYDDAEKLANIRMVKEVIAQVGQPDEIANTIDKVALFNGIKKSYPPKPEELAKKFIEGVNFIVFLDKTSKSWEKL